VIDSTEGQVLAIAQLTLATLAGIAAWTLAPDLHASAQHEAFKDFFTTAAQVIAALLVALAIEARFAVQHALLAITSATCLVVGEISAIAALSPALPDAAYSWLFVCTVAGGTGAMVAAIVIGAQALTADAQGTMVRELEELGRRAMRDQSGT
jgi:hypothetical protein